MAPQPLILPGELMDSVIDYLGNDLHELGICGMVCSEWLMRSRYHIFSTVQLWPQRVRAFLELARSEMCTFVHCIHRIELDDSRRNEDEISFCDVMSLSQLSTLSRVESLKFRNMDWTAISPMEQTKLRYHLAEFRQLSRLEFENVVFHDLREVVRIASSFPLLRHLSVHVEFLKYLEYVISSAINNNLPSGLHTIELGTDCDIPVFLSSLSATTGPSNLQALELRNIKSYHWQYIRSAIIKYSATLRHLVLAFADGEFQKMPEGMITLDPVSSFSNFLQASFSAERIFHILAA
ncbi:hypothetical protein BDQ12DRAFT_237575 [Crucibulum laeve]|uniref:F-box domain-containing protein n=1 Tax=Crucibulum laeve TaxID=68775 RepID=A0A5C3LUA8_9AGAR|nr:hypothetical protein BDQ12DRAFT_237575 [Crucibulum laeve]